MVDIQEIPIPEEFEYDQNSLISKICDLRFKLKDMMLELGAIYNQSSADDLIPLLIEEYPKTKVDISLLFFDQTNLNAEKGQIFVQLFKLCSDLDSIMIDLDSNKNIYDIANRLFVAGMTYMRLLIMPYNCSSKDGVRQHYIDRQEGGKNKKGKIKYNDTDILNFYIKEYRETEKDNPNYVGLHEAVTSNAHKKFSIGKTTLNTAFPHSRIIKTIRNRKYCNITNLEN